MYNVLLVDDEPTILEKERNVVHRCRDFFRVVAERYSAEEGMKAFANVKHFFTSLGNEFFTSWGKQFFIPNVKKCLP